MNKLMIALSATAMFSLCANAEDTKASGVNFEDLPVGALDTTEDDAGLTDGIKYWMGTGEVESQIVQGTSDDGNTTKFLKVDETEPLTRTMNGKEADATTVPTDGGVYIKTKVQFTAADEAPEAVDGDKLLVWLKQIEDDPETEADETDTVLMVTDKTGAVATDAKVGTTDWYDLEIRATQSGEEGLEVLGFTVAINGTEVNEGQVFQSIVPYTSTAATTIASVGFKGTGNVDDIEFGTFTKEAENFYEVAGKGYESFADALTAALAAEDATIKLLKNVTIADGLTIGSEEGESQPTVTIDLAGKKMTSAAITITCYGNLTIKDSVGGGSVETTFVPATEEDEVISVMNGGEGDLVIMGGKYKGAVLGETLVTVPGAAEDDAYELALNEETGYYEIKKVGGESDTTYAITTATVEGATVTVDKEEPKAGETVTVTVEVTAEEKVLDYITVNAVKIEGNTFVATEDAVVGAVLKDKTYAITTATVEGATITVDKTEAKKGATVAVTVEVTDETKQLDYITVGGVKIEGTTFEVTGAVEVSAVLKAIPTYTVTAATVDGATVEFDTTEAVVSGTEVTFTVTVTDDTKEINTVTDGTNTLTADAETGKYSVTVADANIVITVTLKAKQGGSDWPADWNGGEAATPAQAAAFTEWAKTNDATATNAKEAFLMGVNVADYAPLAATSIAIVDGKVAITSNAGTTPNGVVYIKYGETVACGDGVVAVGAELPATAPAQFYKVCIDFAMPPAE